MRMKNDFHIKGWTPTLVLKQRPGGTRKWPIEWPQDLAIDMFIFCSHVQVVLRNCRNFAPQYVEKVLKSCSVSKTLPSKIEKVALKLLKIRSFVYCNLNMVFNHSSVVTPTTSESCLASAIFVLTQHTHSWNYRNHYGIPDGQPVCPLLLLRKCVHN